MNRNRCKAILDTIINKLKGQSVVVLESQLDGHPSSQINFVAFKPKRTIRAYGSKIIETGPGGEKVYEQDPWGALKAFHNSRSNWLFGYLGYDLKNFTEQVTSENRELVNTPDLYFMEPEILLSICREGKVDILSGMYNFGEPENRGSTTGVVSNLKREIIESDFKKNIEEIKQRIKEGDFYEVNYSYPITGNYSGDPFWLYRQMREINPVPFAGFIKTEDFSVCCASPERFLKREADHIISEPIKGTTGRSENAEQDSRLKEKLLSNKNKAENLMIVDLVRHDFSKVAKTGSVRVSKLYDVQTFGTVHQLISTIEADVDSESNSVDIIKACFPMGSMTGAPKIEVMKAIEKLEVYRRGIYSGAIGYFKPNGDFDFNVVIRSAIIQNGNLVYPVGGAITTDSDPADEWEETEIKARTITKIKTEIETK